MFEYQYLLLLAVKLLLFCNIYGGKLLCKSASVTQDGFLMERRILGGQSTLENEILSIVALKREDGYNFCAGTIIQPKWILTAASCFEDSNVEDLSSIIVVGGVHNISSENEVDNQIRNALRILIHPNYTAKHFENDIALVELVDAFDLNDVVKAAKLQPTFKLIERSAKGLIAGWGDYTARDDHPEILLKATVSFVEYNKCQEIYTSIVKILPSMLCAGTGDVGPCDVDLGGPLYCRVKGEGNTRFLCGIVAGGPICSTPGFPGIYTRITSYADWISEFTKCP